MRKVFLYPNPNRDNDFKLTIETVKLIRESGLEPIIPENIGLRWEDTIRMPFCEGIRSSDMIICIGGDGTILRIAETAAREDKPILGINAGKLGFLAELEKDELYRLKSILNGSFSIDHRSMLDVCLLRNEQTVFEGTALNDAVVTTLVGPRVMSFDFWVGNHFIATISGDGLIASTPTGSSAYSLSAGGPLVEPSADLILVTPICAHSLHAKSFVLSGKSTVKFQNTTVGVDAQLTIDGVTNNDMGMQTGDTVVISKSHLYCKLVRSKNHGFYDIVRNKLIP
ncbi:MAG: NAD(+)/NADH kinase [Eubacteriales bacterium]|jgi:NAD+ kinase